MPSPEVNNDELSNPSSEQKAFMQFMSMYEPKKNPDGSPQTSNIDRARGFHQSLMDRLSPGEESNPQGNSNDWQFIVDALSKGEQNQRTDQSAGTDSDGYLMDSDYGAETGGGGFGGGSAYGKGSHSPKKTETGVAKRFSVPGTKMIFDSDSYNMGSNAMKKVNDPYKVIMFLEDRSSLSEDGHMTAKVNKINKNIDSGGNEEVFGINDKYHPEAVKNLKALISSGRNDEAVEYARNYTFEYTEKNGAGYATDPGVKIFLADMIFNSGPTGAKNTLKKIPGIKPGPMKDMVAQVEAMEDPVNTLAQARAEYYSGLSNFEPNAGGWAARNSALTAVAEGLREN